MNAHNNENDPFEDVFRDRFADFESEPDTQLWQKIEPKLPADSTRKFPYWQISAVVILLLLAGLWTYREKNSDDEQVENLATPLTDYASQWSSQTAKNVNPPLSVSPQTTALNNSLTINALTKNTTNDINVKLEEKIFSPKPSFGKSTTAEVKQKFLHESSVGTTGTHSQTTAGTQTTADNKKSSLFSNPNTTIELSNTSFNKTTDNNFSENNKNQLNLIPVNNSNEKRETNIENASNNSSTLSVFSNKENVSVLSKNFLTSLDSKSYSLLRNQFKTPRIKFVIAPKKDDYFKERKPLEIYASVMPLLNYYTITPNGNDANYVHSIAVNNDDNRLGFYTQAGVIFTLSDRFKLRTGLTFTRTNHSISYQIRTDSLIVQPSDRQGVDVSFAELNKNYSQSANYLGTKIEVQYIFLEGEALSHYLNIGLEGAYRLNGVKQFNGFANFAYGVTRQIGDNSYLFIEPTFSYSLNQQSDNNSFLLVKPNKIGFNIGVNFKIK